jgi:glycosyltransferase involved in cell wall biosynthesis
MKILINRKPIEGPWGGGNLLVKAFCAHMSEKGHSITHEPGTGIDAILIQDPRPGNTGFPIDYAIKYKNLNPGTKIIQRINECDARKNTSGVDRMLRECSAYVDATIFVSNWMKEYHLERGWKCGNNYVIHNGADLNHFHPREKLKNNKINIVTHHWSNNVLKGFDIYEAIDEFVGQNGDFTFTYIGRCRNTFKNTKVVPPLFGAALGEELSKYDIYISGSRFDPGPNHILESLACGIPTYVFKDGGGCVEFAGEDHVYSSFENLRTLLLSRNYSKNAFEVSSWEHCIDNFEKLMNEVLSR